MGRPQVGKTGAYLHLVLKLWTKLGSHLLEPGPAPGGDEKGGGGKGGSGGKGGGGKKGGGGGNGGGNGGGGNGNGNGGNGGGNGGGGSGARRRHAVSEWTPPALLWLVQRDFLQGSTVDEYLAEALKPVGHAASDEHGERLNAIRETLANFGGGGGGMSGLGLPLPHSRRTELCDLPMADLSQEYVAGLGQVRGWVTQHASGKGAGRVWRNGAEMAAQVAQLVGVLNAQRIPTAGSVIGTHVAARTHD